MIGSKSAANKVVRVMQSRYGAVIKKSRKLYGLIEGKKSYRDTILVSIGKKEE
jgi:NMD protein affecting ribosome stability and mRNA decay